MKKKAIKNKKFKLLWEKTKKPIIFASIVLIVVWLLVQTDDLKKLYDKQNKSSIVIYEKESREPKSVRLVERETFTSKIVTSHLAKDSKDESVSKKNQCKKEKIEGNEKFVKKQCEILEASVKDILYKNFNNETEMLNAIDEAVLKHRDIALGSLHNSLARAYKAEDNVRRETLKELVEAKSILEKYAQSYTGEINAISFKEDYLEKINKGLPPNKKIRRNFITDSLDAIDFDQVNKNQQAKVNDNTDEGKTITKKKTHSQQLEDALDEKFNSYFSNKTIAKVKDEIKENVEKLSNDYQPIFRHIYLTRGEWGKKEIVFNSGNQAKSKQTPILATIKNIPTDFKSYLATQNQAKLFLDEKGLLFIGYTLLRVTLQAVIIFAILYVILIFFRNVYFLFFAQEAITNQATSYIGLKNLALIAPALAPNLFPTLTAIGIASAAVVATQLPITSSDNSTSQTSPIVAENVVTSSGLTTRPKTSANDRNPYRNFYPYDIIYNFPTDNSINMNEKLMNNLNQNLSNLQRSIVSLDKRIQDTDFTRKFEITDITQGKDHSNDFESLFGLIGKFNPTENEKKKNEKTLFGRFAQMSEIIGQPSLNPTFANDNLFGKVNRLSYAIGTDRYHKGKKLPSISDQLGFFDGNGNPSSGINNKENLANYIRRNQNTVRRTQNTVEDIKDETNLLLDTSDYVMRNTDYIADNSDVIKDDTNKIQINQLGRGDKNIITQAKSLVTPEKFKVTPLAYKLIETQVFSVNEKQSCTTQPNNKLCEMLVELKSMERVTNPISKKEIKRRLKPILGKKWKHWHNLIFRITRVRRY